MSYHVMCDACKEVTKYSDERECKHCRVDFCKQCISGALFIHDNEMHCIMCWKPTVKRIKPEKLLQLALKKLKTDKDALEEEFRNDPANSVAYREPRDTYRCTQCKEPCASVECSSVGDDSKRWNDYGYEGDDDERKYPIYHRDHCCKALGGGADEVCSGCKRWQVRRVAITLLGIHRFRRSRRRETSGLTQVPKDVLRHHIIKQIFLP